jgi:hypothetical protein
MTNDFEQIRAVLSHAIEDLMKLVPTPKEKEAPLYAGTAAILIMLMRDKFVHEKIDPAFIQADWKGVSTHDLRGVRKYWLKHLLDVANLNRAVLFELKVVTETTLLSWLKGGKKWSNTRWRTETASAILGAIQLTRGEIVAGRYKELIALLFDLEEDEFNVYKSAKLVRILQKAHAIPADSEV